MSARRLAILLLFIFLALFGAAGGITAAFYFTQPKYSGSVAMPGLTGAVTVYRDEHGVPHIFAADMNDAARALGYIHASERLFQMEMQRRAGQGRLSEILGKDMLDVDKFTRTLGLFQLARDSYQALSPDAQKFFDSYAEGVNFWMQTHRRRLPPEFVLLDLKPEPWTPADSLVWGKLMALQLSGNYRHEILRAHLAAKLAPADIEKLLPPPPADAPVTTRPELSKNGAMHFSSPRFAGGEGDPAMQEKIFDKLGAITGLARAASNEWAISGTRTESGKPILANDPHLGLEAPILWYLARIVTPGLALEGATVPGLPVVLLGQNDHIAWGFTTTGSDVQDLFIETVDPQHPDQYLVPDPAAGGAELFATRTELIRVKGDPDVKLTVRSTRHGPVLSDIDPELAALAGAGKVVALSFTALEAGDTTTEAILRINRAQNWQDFIAALKLYKAPPQNIVYADTGGNIGFVGAGLVPIRKKGDGLTPADGASGDYDWNGLIPFEQWPQLYNPPAGFVFNANNAIVGPDSAYFYGRDWEEPFRAERLQQLFDTIGKHSLDTSAAMQADITSLAAKQLLPYLLRQTFSDPQAVQALDKLRLWDGAMNKDRAEPLIFEAWLFEMHKLLLTDKAADPLKAEGPFDAAAMLVILADPGNWCGTPDPQCDNVIKKSFTDALALLAARDGPDINQWRWGKEQVTVLRHKFWSHIPVLNDQSDLSIASGGDYYTLDRGGSAQPNPENPFVRTHGPGFRGIYDLSDPSKSRFMIATGESGHIFSRHYGDLVKPWNDVQSFTLAGTQDELKARGLPELVFESAGQP